MWGKTTINYNKPLIWEWFIPKKMVTGGWCKWHCFTHVEAPQIQESSILVDVEHPQGLLDLVSIQT